VGPNSAINCIGIGSQQVKVSGSTVLLTGATGGLGGALARALHQRGARLLLTGRRREELAQLADELDARAVVADLADRRDVLRLADEAGPVEILIANAALPAAAPLTHLTAEEIDRVIDVNLRAPALLARALAPAMIDAGRGHIVLISSIGGRAAARGNPLYHATKFALRGLAGGLRIDLRDSGVGVSCVLPGFIRDAGLYAESGARLPPGVGTRSPDDVARAVIGAIERDRAEVNVSTPSLRLGAVLWALAPDLAAGIAARLGSKEIAATFEEGLQAKR
jgi:short-subunit dehydrogenase